jgi:hypothetical protein
MPQRLPEPEVTVVENLDDREAEVITRVVTASSILLRELAVAGMDSKRRIILTAGLAMAIDECQSAHEVLDRMLDTAEGHGPGN